MSDIFEKSKEAAATWDQMFFYIRTNVGFIQGELDQVALERVDIEDIASWANGFQELQAVLASLEVQLFSEARRLDNDYGDFGVFLRCINTMHSTLLPWILKLDELVQSRRAGEPNSASALILSVGADINMSFQVFTNSSRGFLKEIESYIARNLASSDTNNKYTQDRDRDSEEISPKEARRAFLDRLEWNEGDIEILN